MRLKNSLFFKSLFAGLFTSAVALSGESESKSKFKPEILINESSKCADSKVEEGTAVIKGKASTTESGARRNWQRACRAWQRRLHHLNRQNLMIDDCGLPSAKTVSGTADTQEILFESRAIYKIKLGCP